MASLSRSAARFQQTFPTVKVDALRLDRALNAFDARKIAPMTRLTNLAGALLLEPPVDDLAVPFAQELLVAALRRMGADATEAEAHAAAIVEGIAGLGERPLFSLHISIGAPRRGVPVTMLSYLDQVIESIHARLTEALAHPVGPQEHADGLPRDEMMPSDQWEGHITDTCVPAHRHDALLILPGRSIGVGESIAIAGTLLVPVFALEMPVPTEGSTAENANSDMVSLESAVHGTSCRIKDKEIVTRIRTAATTPGGVAEQVVTDLEAAAAHIRQRQRMRMRHMLEAGEYRAYLASRSAVSTACAATRRRVEDPFEFASLTDLQRDDLAAEIDAMTSADFNLVSMLGSEAAAGFRAFMASGVAPGGASGVILRAGLKEMARFADEPLKAARPFVWNEDGWRRLWANMAQS